MKLTDLDMQIKEFVIEPLVNEFLQFSSASQVGDLLRDGSLLKQSKNGRHGFGCSLGFDF